MKIVDSCVFEIVTGHSMGDWNDFDRPNLRKDIHAYWRLKGYPHAVTVRCNHTDLLARKAQNDLIARTKGIHPWVLHEQLASPEDRNAPWVVARTIAFADREAALLWKLTHA